MQVVKIRKKKERICDTVLVLLSSYNGEKFIKEQIESLLKQTMPVFVLIRDDGSTDNTVSIISDFTQKCDYIKLIKGENIGYIGSFNALINNDLVDEYEWIAFCDQDDVWLPSKLSVAVNSINKNYDPEIPTLYFSNLMETDENLNEIKPVYSNRKTISKYKLIIGDSPAGCTSVFNQAAAVVYRAGLNIPMPAHDYEMYCVCIFMGRVIYDPNYYILYRQHGKNVCGLVKSKTYTQGFKDVLKDIFTSKSGTRVKWLTLFLKRYGRYLSKEDRRLLRIFVGHGGNLLYRMGIVFDPRFCGYDIKTTIAFKVRALVNRMY